MRPRKHRGTVAEDQLLIGFDDAARILGISRSSIYNLARSGDLRAIKVGGRHLIVRSSLEAFVANGRPAYADAN